MATSSVNPVTYCGPSSNSSWPARGKEEGDARGAAICLSEMGITWERAGEGERGARLLNEAAEEAEACGEMQMAARWHNMAVIDPEGRRMLHGFDGLAFIAACLRAATGQPDEEIITIAKNIISEARGKNRRLESMARNALAGLYALRGQFHQALTQLKVAIQIVDSTRDQWSRMMFRANLANISFRANGLGKRKRLHRKRSILLRPLHAVPMRQKFVRLPLWPF